MQWGSLVSVEIWDSGIVTSLENESNKVLTARIPPFSNTANSTQHFVGRHQKATIVTSPVTEPHSVSPCILTIADPKLPSQPLVPKNISNRVSDENRCMAGFRLRFNVQHSASMAISIDVIRVGGCRATCVIDGVRRGEAEWNELSRVADRRS